MQDFAATQGISHTAIGTSPVRPIAFYLPQFHPIPENDEWWGAGFTEWRNVVRAKPLFRGHYQPHLPADLGFYDLRLPETREAQAAMAREYGIHGFCYYHYWFNGRRLLERPFDEVLKSGKPDFPFCLCWANENWTRAWDGFDRKVLLRQDYSDEDDLAHIRHFLPALADPRYIRLGGKPLLLVYNVLRLPNPQKTAEIWRNEAIRQGVGDLCLARVDRFGDFDENLVDVARHGFDVAVEFHPNGRLKPPRFGWRLRRVFHRLNLQVGGRIGSHLYDYATVAAAAVGLPRPKHRWLRCVMPSWDNTSRRRSGASVYRHSTPEKYKWWLEQVIEQELEACPQEPTIFINAWNEWAEGCHLEPDLKFGRAYLEATRDALMSQRAVAGVANAQ